SSACPPWTGRAVVRRCFQGRAVGAGCAPGCGYPHHGSARSGRPVAETPCVPPGPVRGGSTPIPRRRPRPPCVRPRRLPRPPWWCRSGFLGGAVAFGVLLGRGGVAFVEPCSG